MPMLWILSGSNARITVLLDASPRPLGVCWKGKNILLRTDYQGCEGCVNRRRCNTTFAQEIQMFVTRGRPHLPPCPPSSPTLWERKGGIMPLTSPLPPFLSHAVGEEGGLCPSPPPCPLPLPRCGSRGGNKRSRGDLTTQLTPLPQRGRGAGGEGRPHLPPAPPSSPTLWERRGGCMQGRAGISGDGTARGGVRTRPYDMRGRI